MLRILVVDDWPDTADSYRELLEFRGDRVAVAESGEEALALATEFRPEAVILDLGLPRMDGHEVARRLRRMHFEPLTIIMVSGFGGQEDRRLAREAGCDYYLVKPADCDELLRLLPPARAGESPASG